MGPSYTVGENVNAVLHSTSMENSICCAVLNRFQFSSVQLLSHVRLFATPWIPACQASLSFTISRSSLKLTSIELVIPSSHLILCRPLFLLPPIPPSIRVFSNESTLHIRWLKYWSFSFSIIPSKEYPGLSSVQFFAMCHGSQPFRLLCPWDSPGKNTGVGCHALLQGIFLNQVLSPHLLSLLDCWVFLYRWDTEEDPWRTVWRFLKKKYHMIQQSHSWACTQRKL